MNMDRGRLENDMMAVNFNIENGTLPFTKLNGRKDSCSLPGRFGINGFITGGVKKPHNKG